MDYELLRLDSNPVPDSNSACRPRRQRGDGLLSGHEFGSLTRLRRIELKSSGESAARRGREE